jgi:N6-adenosine-specific RNA methylase IME4
LRIEQGFLGSLERERSRRSEEDDGIGDLVASESRLRLEILAEDPERSGFAAHQEVAVLVSFLHGAGMIA